MKEDEKTLRMVEKGREGTEGRGGKGGKGAVVLTGYIVPIDVSQAAPFVLVRHRSKPENNKRSVAVLRYPSSVGYSMFSCREADDETRQSLATKTMIGCMSLCNNMIRCSRPCSMLFDTTRFDPHGMT